MPGRPSHAKIVPGGSPSCTPISALVHAPYGTRGGVAHARACAAALTSAHSTPSARPRSCLATILTAIAQRPSSSRRRHPVRAGTLTPGLITVLALIPAPIPPREPLQHISRTVHTYAELPRSLACTETTAKPRTRPERAPAAGKAPGA